MQYNTENDYVTRIHLKTKGKCREDLIDFCLHHQEKQYLAIGWSYVYLDENKKVQINDFANYEAYRDAVKNSVKRMNPALDVFEKAKPNDLFWTRDLNGFYWICRVKSKAESYFDEDKDIGAVLPVEAYQFGLEVPGQIKNSFNRPRGGTVHKINKKKIIEYSKFIFNKLSKKQYYEINVNIENKGDNWLENLPAFELEELIISYLQIEKDYYVLSNSIANKSTTIKIECELFSRDVNKRERAVVQVKGGEDIEINSKEYEEYVKKGYVVYLYAPKIKNTEGIKVEIINPTDIIKFYQNHKSILPESITIWENLFVDTQ